MRKLGVLTTSALLAAGLATALSASPAAAGPGDTCDAILFWDMDDKQVWLIDDDGSDAFDVGAAYDGHADPTNNQKPVWSPDGSQIAWSGDDGSGQEIHVANTDGTGRIVISDVDSDPDPTNNLEPTWSPDGSQIAWTGSDGATTQIYVADADGTNRIAISDVDLEGDEPTANDFPQFSPDGSMIMWTGNDGSTNQVYVADTDGTERYAISDVDIFGAEPTDNEWARWAPDSDWITWSGNDGGGREIYVASTSTGGAVRTIISDVDSGTDPTDNWDPTFSPSGDRIAWAGVFSGHRRLIVADADGTNRTIFTSANSAAEWPEWQPRTSTVNLSSTTTADLELNDSGQTEITAQSDCSAGGVEIDIEEADCWGGALVNPSTGTWDGNTWTIPMLDGSETITFSGTVQNGPNCDGSADVTNTYPSLGSSSSHDFGVKADCDTTATPFEDLSEATYGQDEVACIYNLEITNGVNATTYGHNQVVTRQQMAAFLARMYRAVGGECDNSATPFTDIADLSYGQDDIACIYNLGVTQGVNATTYGPDMSVTRQQMGVFLARMYIAVGGLCDGSWTVLEDVQYLPWGSTHINCIYNLGITTGTSPTTYSPLNLVTRLQMGVFLARLWNVITDDGFNTEGALT